MAQRDSRRDWRSLLQQAQETFYAEALSALEELETAYLQEAKVYSQTLRQRGHTFDKEDQAVHRKLSSEQLARLNLLFAQVRQKTESLPEVRHSTDQLLSLQAKRSPPTPALEENSLTYSKDSTPACTPRVAKAQGLVLSPLEAMAVRLQAQEMQDRAARKSALFANQQWSH